MDGAVGEIEPPDLHTVGKAIQAGAVAHVPASALENVAGAIEVGLARAEKSALCHATPFSELQADGDEEEDQQHTGCYDAEEVKDLPLHEGSISHRAELPIFNGLKTMIAFRPGSRFY